MAMLLPAHRHHRQTTEKVWVAEAVRLSSPRPTKKPSQLSPDPTLTSILSDALDCDKIRVEEVCLTLMKEELTLDLLGRLSEQAWQSLRSECAARGFQTRTAQIGR